MRKIRAACTIMAALAMPLLTSVAHAADIKVLSDGPLRSALSQIAERFQRESEHKVHLTFGAGPALKGRIAAGESAELLITAATDTEELTKQGKLSPEGQAVVARVAIGLAIREGVPVPDISSVDALKETLLRADSVVLTNLTSGAHFLKVAERLGIAEDVKSKSTQLPSGPAVFDELLKRNGRDIGIGAITQIMEYEPKGLRLVGPLPAPVQFVTTFTAAVPAGAKAAEAAREFIRFLQKPESKAVFAAAGAG
jgi:molybdate transport system substrate-binding protein